MNKSSIQNAASVLTLGDLPPNVLASSHEDGRVYAHNLEEDANKLNSALTRLRNTSDMAHSTPLVAPADSKAEAGLKKGNPLTSSHSGLYGLSERDNWLLSKEPETQQRQFV